MRTINFEELEILKAHLNNRPFQYEEVYNEVLDHYATAYENSENELDQVLAEMDEVFPNHRIALINSKYLDDLRKQLRKSHWTIFLGNFRWPQIVYTILIGILCIGLAPFLILSEWFVYPLWLVLGCTPLILALYYYSRWGIRRIKGQTKLKNGHAQMSGIVVGTASVYIQLPNIPKAFTDDEINLLMTNELVTALILFVGVILALTSITFAQTKLKPAIL